VLVSRETRFETAIVFLVQGNYLWNSGFFVLKPEFTLRIIKTRAWKSIYSLKKLGKQAMGF
jgi:mannose-1-phosphate guanylyltransferase